MKTTRLLGAFALAVTCLVSHAAHAEPCTVIRGATIHVPGGEAVTGQALRLSGDLISGIAPDRGPAEGCRDLLVPGAVVTAGFIDPMTTMGLVEIDGESATNDTDNKALFQDGQQLVRAAVRTSLAFNPRSAPIEVARVHGVTSSLSFPVGGVIAGQGFAIDHRGTRRTDAIIQDPVALLVQLGARGESRATSLHVLDVALREANIWRKDKNAIEKNLRAPLLTSALDLDALVPVFDRKLPLVVRIDRASDIESLLVMVDPKVRLVLVGAAEAWLVSDLLVARDVAVILDPLLYGPGGFDQLAARRDHAAVLSAAGVKVMMSPMDTHLVKKLPQLVGNAIREGMPFRAGLLAVTETPADVFGLAGRGRLQAGARANVVVWSGDPFELSTEARHVFIGGVEVPRETRATRLLSRWRTLPTR